MKNIINLTHTRATGEESTSLTPSEIKAMQDLVADIGTGKKDGMYVIVEKTKQGDRNQVEGGCKVFNMSKTEVKETLFSVTGIDKAEMEDYTQNRKAEKDKPEAMDDERKQEALDLLTKLADSEINGAFFIIEDQGEYSNVLGKVNNQTRAQMLTHLLKVLEMNKVALEMYIKQEMND